MPVEFYGSQWPDGTEQIKAVFWMLKQNDELLKTRNITRLQLYIDAHSLLWKEDKQHAWFLLGLKAIVENKVSVFLGCANSGKTYLMAIHALIDFFAFPSTSFSLISSTEGRSLDIKVWGRVKTLFNRARAKYPFLPGYVLNSKRAITPDPTDDENETAQETDKGIICVPCVSGGRFVGMGKFQGAKPPHSPGNTDGILKHYGDEAAVMQSSFLDAYTNWMSNVGFKGVMAGNPTDISDPLCVASEPVGGWDAFEDNGGTQTWTSRWYGAFCVAFDGRSTPNKDFPLDQFPFLAGSSWVETLIKTHGEDSWEVWQQGIGKPSRGMVSNRVITIGLCERHKAFHDVIWKGSSLTKLISLDPAYAGGDRCVCKEIQFGADVNGKIILSIGTPEMISIKLNSKMDAEDQIAAHMKQKSDALGIPPQNMFYDSFGRGTLGAAFAKVFGSTCPVPIDSGQITTDRPVRFDLYVTDFKNGRNEKRLKTCREHYSKFVTEMWFSVREAIESEQIRNLQMETAQEGQLRLYSIVKGNKIEVESKDDMKERVKKSPDLFDTLAIGVEGARRLGFRIERIGKDMEDKEKDRSHLEKLRSLMDKHRSSYQLSHR